MGQHSMILKVSVSWLLLYLQVMGVFSEMNFASRIVNGIDATIEEIPYLVQIWRDGKFLCGGTIASDRHIITAAHCVDGKSPDQFTIVAGASQLSDVGIRSKVSEIKIHPRYNKLQNNADMAVLKLESQLTGLSLELPRKCEDPMKVGDNVQVFGWGRLSEDATQFSNQLQTVNLTIISFAACQDEYRSVLRITPNMFCTETPGKDACRGDSGGPVLVNGQFCGIVSFGSGCARPGFAGVNVYLNNVLKFWLDYLKV